MKMKKKIQKYKIIRFVEITKLARGRYHVRCQNRIWETTNKPDAIRVKRWIQERDCEMEIPGLIGPLKLTGK